MRYLDGLRGVSIAMVVANHLRLRLPGPIGQELTSAFSGQTGVDVFFVLSGYLITALLLREREVSGSVSLKSFYLRRMLRIIPGYFAFLFALWVFTLTKWSVVSPRSWFLALTYTASLAPIPEWPLAHTWSLAVEEQFYLLWPLCVMWLTRRATGAVSVLVIIGTLVFREGVLVLPPRLQPNISYCTLTRADAIMVGCLLGVLFSSPGFARASRRLASRGWIAGAGLLLLTALPWMSRHLPAQSLVYTARAMGIAVILWWLVAAERCWLARVLCGTPFVWLGRLSYSLYLWQQPFLNRWSDAWVCRYPQNLCLAMGFAYLSWLLVETPFLRIKDRLRAPGDHQKQRSRVGVIGAEA